MGAATPGGGPERDEDKERRRRRGGEGERERKGRWGMKRRKSCPLTLTRSTWLVTLNSQSRRNLRPMSHSRRIPRSAPAARNSRKQRTTQIPSPADSSRTVSSLFVPQRSRNRRRDKLIREVTRGEIARCASQELVASSRGTAPRTGVRGIFVRRLSFRDGT